MDPSVSENIAIHINDKEGNRLAQLTAKSPKETLSCFNLAEANILLVDLPTGFLQPTNVLITETLTGMNGTDVLLKVKQEITQVQSNSEALTQSIFEF